MSPPLCCLCRTASILDPLLPCPNCPRSYHHSCWLLSSPHTSQPCPQCLRLCPRCLSSIESEVTCARCRGKYHKRCEKLMDLHPGRQLCSLCVKELTQDRSEIIAKYGFIDVDGKRYYLLRFRSVSVLHMSYAHEGVCAGVPACEEFPPTAAVAKVVLWRETDGTKEGLVALENRGDSEATWETITTIHAINPDITPCTSGTPGVQGTVHRDESPPAIIEILSSSSDVSSPGRPQAPPSPPTIVSIAYEVLFCFGYDLNDTEKSALHAYKRLKLQSQGVVFVELMEAMRELLGFVCSCLGEERALYKGVDVEPRKLFCRHLEVAMMRKRVGLFHCTGETTVSHSALYTSSLSHLPHWTPRDDLLLLAAVLFVGYGNWVSLPPSLENLKSASEAAASVGTSVDHFLQCRVRFLAYCLMLDEYEEVVAFRE